MTQPSPSRKPGAASGLRSMILIVAVSATLALWALFSKIERDQAAAVAPAPLSSAAPAEAAPGELVLNLPAIPTLIPALAPQNPAAQTGALPALATPTPFTPPAFAPIKILGRDRSARPDRPARSGNGGGGGGGGGGGTTNSSR